MLTCPGKLRNNLWKTKKQSVIFKSSSEAKYRALTTTVSEVLWIHWLLHDLKAPQQGATPLYCNNQAYRHISNNSIFHERTKHMEIDCYFVCESVEYNHIQSCYINTHDQVANIFMKPLGMTQFHFLLDRLGVRDLHGPI